MRLPKGFPVDLPMPDALPVAAAEPLPVVVAELPPVAAAVAAVEERKKELMHEA